MKTQLKRALQKKSIIIPLKSKLLQAVRRSVGVMEEFSLLRIIHQQKKTVVVVVVVVVVQAQIHQLAGIFLKAMIIRDQVMVLQMSKLLQMCPPVAKKRMRQRLLRQ
jgi:hypothetical protein